VYLHTPARFVYIFLLFETKNYGVAAIELAASNSSPGLLHLDLQILAGHKKGTHRMVCAFFVMNTQFRYHFSDTKKSAMLPNFYLFRSQDSTFVIIALWRHALPE